MSAKKKESKTVSEREYEHPDDEQLEGKPVEKIEDLPEKDIEQIKEAQNVLADEKAIIPHFDESTQEFLKKIDNLPTLTPEVQNKITKHYSDKKETWILSHIDDGIFPIRFKVRDKKSDKEDIIRYKRKTVDKNGKKVSTFDYEEKFFEGQSIAPAHQHKLSMMNQKEAILLAKLEDVQQKINNVLTTRNLISKVLERQEEEKDEAKKLPQSEIVQLLKDFRKAVDELPQDFLNMVDKIQREVNEAIYQRSKFQAYAYFTIEEEEYDDAFISDIKDYTEVLQKREQLRVPT